MNVVIWSKASKSKSNPRAFAQYIIFVGHMIDDQIY
jgi:hypothetical protein